MSPYRLLVRLFVSLYLDAPHDLIAVVLRHLWGSVPLWPRSFRSKDPEILFGKKFIVFQWVWLPDRAYKSFQYTNISVRVPLWTDTSVSCFVKHSKTYLGRVTNVNINIGFDRRAKGMNSCTAVYAIKIQHTPDTNQQLAAFHLSPVFFCIQGNIYRNSVDKVLNEY